MLAISRHRRNFAVVKFAGYLSVFAGFDEKTTRAIRADKNRDGRCASFIEGPLLKPVIAHVYATLFQVLEDCADRYGVRRPNCPRFVIPQAFEREHKGIERIISAALVNQISEGWYE
jgi:hypothetical protein